MEHSQRASHPAAPRAVGQGYPDRSKRLGRAQTPRVLTIVRSGFAVLVAGAVAGAFLAAARESGRAAPAFAANGGSLRPGVPYEIAVDGVPLPRVAPRWELRQYPVAEPPRPELARLARAVLPERVPERSPSLSAQAAIEVDYAWIAAETPQLLTVSLPNLPLPALIGEPAVAPVQSLALTLLRHGNLTGISVAWPSQEDAAEAASSPPGWLTQPWVPPGPLYAPKLEAMVRQAAASAQPDLLAPEQPAGRQPGSLPPLVNLVVPGWPTPPREVARASQPPPVAVQPVVANARGEPALDTQGGSDTEADVELSAGPRVGQAAPRARRIRRDGRSVPRATAVRWPPRAAARPQPKPAVRVVPPRPAIVRAPPLKPAKTVAKPAIKATPKVVAPPAPPAVAVKKVVQRPRPKPVKAVVIKPKAKPAAAKPKPGNTSLPALPKWTTN